MILLAEAAISNDSTITVGLLLAMLAGGIGFVSSWSGQRHKLDENARKIDAVETAMAKLEGVVAKLERWRQREIGAASVQRRSDTGPQALHGGLASTTAISTPSSDEDSGR